MYVKKTHITLKVFFSYLILILLVITAAWFIYNESMILNKNSNSSKENEKLFEISSLLAHMYESENLAKATLLSTKKKDFNFYKKKVSVITKEINSLKQLIDNSFQIQQLDSLSFLLQRKHKNIKELRRIKINTETDISFKVGIEELTKMESSLSKITIDHLVKEPEKLEGYQKEVIDKLVFVLNENIPNKANNSVNRKAVDSILTASKLLLKDLRSETQIERSTLKKKENELLINDFTISEQIRQIITNIEAELFFISIQNETTKEAARVKTSNIITITGVIGFFLIIFFSFLILHDFWKSQLYRKQLEATKTYTESLLRSREELIKMVSHDLKTPLSSIQSYIDLLHDTSIDKKQNSYIKQLKNATVYITNLVDDLLTFSKLESGKLDLKKRLFNLKKLLENTSESICKIYQNKPIKFKLEIIGDFEEVAFLGGDLRITQIITNLLSNAFKFTDKGEILLKVTGKSKNTNIPLITISVTDTGIGIPFDKQEIIFKEFSKNNYSKKQKYDGHGLGLSISKRLALAMKGSLFLTSEEGKGSSFIFEIPLKIAAGKKSSLLPSTKQRFTSKRLKALVIDDNLALRKLIKEILQKNNIEVLDFEKATNVLNQLASLKFDIVFTDLQMPKMNGYSFAKKLQESSFYENQPIIAISGAIKENILTNDVVLFSDFIKKPFSPLDIINCIQKYFNHTSSKNIIEKTNQKIQFKSNYNLSSLYDFLEDEKLVKEVIDTFIKNSSKDLDRINNAFHNNDLNAIKDIAHKIKPMYQHIKATHIVLLLNRLQNTGELSAIKKIIKQLNNSTDKLKKDLATENTY